MNDTERKKLKSIAKRKNAGRIFHDLSLLNVVELQRYNSWILEVQKYDDANKGQNMYEELIGGNPPPEMPLSLKRALKLNVIKPITIDMDERASERSYQEMLDNR
jgi:hypothetical protein